MGVGGKAAYAGANLALGGTIMGLQTLGAEYKQARDRGLTPVQTIPYAASQAAIEVATESMPAIVFFKNLKQGAPFLKTISNALATELTTEQVNTVLQDANEWAVLNPEKTFKDYLSERPDRAVSTAISTITSTLILGSAGHTVQRIADRKAKKDLQAYQANVMGEVMKQTSDATRQSKLAERDPETFQTYLQSVFNQSGVENVYLSAEVLAQSGLVEKMAEVMPSVKEQAALATETGQDLKIPAAEYFAYAPKIDTTDSLLPHLKVDANGMTVAEAQEYLPKAKELLQTDFEQEAAKAEQEDSFKESAQKVQDTITQQLIATGRFTNDQARIQASLTGAVYAATAKRLNMTPEALFNVYQMNVVGGEPVGVELNQALKSNPPRGWVHTEGVEDAKALWRGELQQGEQPAQAVYWTDGLGKLEEQFPDLAGYSISISRSAVQHIKDRHGDDSKERQRGQIGITESDIAGIPSVIQNYDDVLYEDIAGTNNKRFAFAKRVDDGVIVYIADSSKKRQDVHVVSMWKYPTTANVQEVLQHATSLARTSKTGEASFHEENANTVSDESQYYQNAINQRSTKAERLEKLRKAPSIRITGNEIEASDDLKQYKKNAIEYGKKLRGTYTNKDTGQKIAVERASIQEIARHDYKNADHLQSIAAVPQIIENGVYIGSLKNEEPDKPNIESFDYYLAGLNIGGKEYTVKAVIANGRDGTKYYDHKLTDMEKGELLSLADRVSTTERAKENSPLLDIDDKRLLQILQEGEERTGSNKPYSQTTSARGSYNPATNTITLGEKADMSTFIHEQGHFYLDMMAGLATKLQQQPAENLTAGDKSILNDVQTILKWFGVESLAFLIFSLRYIMMSSRTWDF